MIDKHLLTFIVIFSLTILIVSKIDSSINSMEKHWTEGKEGEVGWPRYVPDRGGGGKARNPKHGDSQGAWDVRQHGDGPNIKHEHDYPTLKLEDLPERTTNIYELAKHNYVSIRDALPTEDNPMPDLEKLEDVLMWRDVIYARYGQAGIDFFFNRSAGDHNGSYNHGGYGYAGHIPWMEGVTGRLIPKNHFNYWMHSIKN